MLFSNQGKKQVVAAFDGGEITSDGGVVLLREAAHRMDLFSRLADCFWDQRDGRYVRYNLSNLLAQRVTGLALGYEDLNDHDALCTDPALRLMAEEDSGKLASSVTLGRVECCSSTGNTRYHKLSPRFYKMQELLCDLFLDHHAQHPHEIILDIDATDIKVHGHQEFSAWNGYYEQRGFLPLYIFAGPHLLWAQLRQGDCDGARGARRAISTIVKQIHKRWCKANSVDFIFGLARNSYLLRKATEARSQTSKKRVKEGRTFLKNFGLFAHIPKTGSWGRPYNVIAKVEDQEGKGQHVRFLMTSLDEASPRVIRAVKKKRKEMFANKQRPGKDIVARVLYENIYCPRGDMENRIKDCQLDLFGYRASAHKFRSNYLRLLLEGFAYVLVTHIRLKALKGTELAQAAPHTIRLKLFKIGAKVIRSVRRIKLSFPDVYPYQALFFTAWKRLAPG
ncbi:IS1380 family transposase [Terasakiella brassicae]|uniref:IS1380 family transposase n=1 Tax=Terasakiella brassicae TaxID=1634917 RepID=A0A917C5G4_9PROT|nr:IS1380 family transposase [Terasakiella brassicae]GGF73112.1 IS1380 family transposase [Terasakiella brassicae]